MESRECTVKLFYRQTSVDIKIEVDLNDKTNSNDLKTLEADMF